ncbi:MAG: phenylalanine--tRNA ligase subunit beta [Roseinatronobacter sp.]|nr:MAG: phenylalanine--tRNA ligase subunit beta [Roseinatronobacter sp.]
MKFTLSWLKDHLETDATLDQITEALTDLGLEVEEVIDPAQSLGAFRIARVIEAAQHPDADRLRLCRVETWPNGPDGPSEEVQVVCGAPNARTGMRGVFAPVGTHVPGTGVDLKPGVIRGQASNGMLCSERELMLSDAHDGIIDLPDDAPLGARFIDYAGLNDPVIDISITPNRPDALGVRGIARDLAARGLGRLKPLDVAPVAGAFPSPVSVSIAPELKDAGCPLFAGRVIRGVKNGPSPDWLQKRLRAIGLRPISTLVDITNFFTFDQNRPLHVFDADKVSGGLRIHPATGGEEVVALDDKTYRLDAGQMVISDDAGIESIAGIMGGAHSGCTDETVHVFLESAYWDPITIAATGRALKVNSDARYRFERGVDPAFTLDGLELATRMVLELCGGEASDVVRDGDVPDTARSYRFDPMRVHSLVGMDIPEAEQRETLAALGFALTGDQASPPTWRPDILGAADLIEEIARVASLSKLQGKPLPRPQAGVARPILTPLQLRERAARRMLAGQGYNECVSYSFIDATSAAAFGGGTEAVRLENPISSEMTHMRPDLLPGLLQAAARNQARGASDMALFEVGPVFTGGEPGEQHVQAAGILVGATVPRDPFGSRRAVDLYDAKADAEAVLAAIGAPAKFQIHRKLPGWFHPGRAGVISLGPKLPLAVFGELHPKMIKAFDLKGPVVGFTVYVENPPQPKARKTTRQSLSISTLQPLERDYAFVLDSKVEAINVVNAAAGADKALITGVQVFDEFTGPKAEAQFGEGRKSLAISVRLQPVERTLTDEDIESISRKIIEKVEKATGGTLRA